MNPNSPLFIKKKTKPKNTKKNIEYFLSRMEVQSWAYKQSLTAQMSIWSHLTALHILHVWNAPLPVASTPIFHSYKSFFIKREMEGSHEHAIAQSNLYNQNLTFCLYVESSCSADGKAHRLMNGPGVLYIEWWWSCSLAQKDCPVSHQTLYSL